MERRLSDTKKASKQNTGGKWRHQPNHNLGCSISKEKHRKSPRQSAKLGDKWNAMGEGQMKWSLWRPHQAPPARLRDQWMATRGDILIGNIWRAGHHKPDLETHGLLQGKQIDGRAGHHQPDLEKDDLLQRKTEDNWIGYIGRAGCHHLDRAGHLFKRELRTSTVNCLGDS